MLERIQKILSAHGVASRREAERLIAEGRVFVNGVAAKLGDSARSDNDDIVVDGVPLRHKDELVYIMLNKPRGYITSVNDELGRKTVMELVKEVGVRIYPVGRLDVGSEGLLLMTNDGRFANAVMHPSHNKSKTYEVRACGDVGNSIQLLRRAMEIDSRAVKAVSVRLREKTADGAVILITINEGRNRQIRKMCAMSGLTVKALKRLSIGPLKLGSLGTGQWRRLTDEEVGMLFG